MKLNTIYTDAEYIAQGFTTKEVPLIRKHDKLFNEYTLKFDDCWGDNLTDEQWEEYTELVKVLDL